MNKVKRDQLDKWFLRKFREMGIEPIRVRNGKLKPDLSKGNN